PVTRTPPLPAPTLFPYTTLFRSLLRIILVGQPEMDTFLARHDLRQLSQRISARFRLTALNRCETVDYINHRLACVGGSGRLFTRSEEHTSELQSRFDLVCRLLLE